MALRYLLLVLALGVPWSAAHAACTAVEGWQTGQAGREAPAECTAEEYLQAHRLGEELHTLETEHRSLAEQLATDPAGSDAGVKQRRQRQLQNDIEAIHGVATINQWPLTPAVAGERP